MIENLSTRRDLLKTGIRAGLAIPVLGALAGCQESSSIRNVRPTSTVELPVLNMDPDIVGIRNRFMLNNDSIISKAHEDGELSEGIMHEIVNMGVELYASYMDSQLPDINYEFLDRTSFDQLDNRCEDLPPEASGYVDFARTGVIDGRISFNRSYFDGTHPFSPPDTTTRAQHLLETTVHELGHAVPRLVEFPGNIELPQVTEISDPIGIRGFNIIAKVGEGECDVRMKEFLIDLEEQAVSYNGNEIMTDLFGIDLFRTVYDSSGMYPYLLSKYFDNDHNNVMRNYQQKSRVIDFISDWGEKDAPGASLSQKYQNLNAFIMGVMNAKG